MMPTFSSTSSACEVVERENLSHIASIGYRVTAQSANPGVQVDAGLSRSAMGCNGLRRIAPDCTGLRRTALIDRFLLASAL